MIPVGNECGAADLFADPDAKDGHGFIAEETDYGGGDDRPEIGDGLWMEESIDGLITGNQSAEQDRQHNRDTGQIFDPAVAVSESCTRCTLREFKGYPQRYRRGGIADVMNGIGKKGHTAG